MIANTRAPRWPRRVDDHLHRGQELGPQSQEQGRYRAQVDHEEQGPVDRVPAQEQPRRRADREGGQDEEGDEAHAGLRDGESETGEVGAPSAPAGSSASSVSLV